MRSRRYTKVAVLMGIILLVASILPITGCARLPEYVVSVQADPGVTWWGILTVARRVNQTEARDRERIPPGTIEASALESWEITLEHEVEGFSTNLGEVRGGRIAEITLQVFNIGGDGFVRLKITRDGKVVAEGETNVTGAAAYCEFSE